MRQQLPGGALKPKRRTLSVRLPTEVHLVQNALVPDARQTQPDVTEVEL